MRLHAIFALLTAPALCVSMPVLAETPPTPAAARQTVAPHHHKLAKPAPAPALAAAPAPPAPKAPDWPVNNPPMAATVVLDSHGLRIQAQNSSLAQILREVSTETGAQVEGFDKDQRIFGTYGPGSTRDVLAQLFDGSGYNLLMVGGENAATPLEVVLSERPTGPAPVVQNSPSDADSEAEEDQPPPPPQPPQEPANGQAPRTPQQIMQELMLRQQQQQQQQHNSPF